MTKLSQISFKIIIRDCFIIVGKNCNTNEEDKKFIRSDSLIRQLEAITLIAFKTLC
jgi:hypothetical protein